MSSFFRANTPSTWASTTKTAARRIRCSGRSISRCCASPKTGRTITRGPKLEASSALMLAGVPARFLSRRLRPYDLPEPGFDLGPDNYAEGWIEMSRVDVIVPCYKYGHFL